MRCNVCKQSQNFCKILFLCFNFFQRYSWIILQQFLSLVFKHFIDIHFDPILNFDHQITILAFLFELICLKAKSSLKQNTLIFFDLNLFLTHVLYMDFIYSLTILHSFDFIRINHIIITKLFFHHNVLVFFFIIIKLSITMIKTYINAILYLF